MQAYQKLSEGLFARPIAVSMPVSAGDERLGCHCFLIVNRIHDMDFADRLAIALLGAGCRNFDFFGAYANEWDLCFDLADVELNPDMTPETVALTNAWPTAEEFAESLSLQREFAEADGFPAAHNLYILYDDPAAFGDILTMLSIS